MSSVESLFKPFEHKSLKLKNRFVMAPMARYRAVDGIFSEEAIAYYERRAKADVGLIITEATAIDREAALNEPMTPRFHEARRESVWKNLIDRLHVGDAKVCPQFQHCGAFPTPEWAKGFKAVKESPSGFTTRDERMGVAMTETDIADTLSAYGRAAKRSYELGMDAVQIHGAHGYLVDQFFWGEVNKRGDKWGGENLAARTRFACEIIKEVRRNVPDDFCVMIRLSQWKRLDYNYKHAPTPGDVERWVLPLVEAGVDIFDLSQRRFWEPEFEGSDLSFAGWVKKLTGKPVITVGSVGLMGEFIASLSEKEASKPDSLDRLVERFENGEFDLVAVGRALLQDPEWVKKIKEGRTGELMNYHRDAMSVMY
jgi:2,4-dienoyl-CoA reductase-like NADH-dependent reductase (Old Yellow Enzyme family)